MNIKTVIFDMDGTLVDSMPLWRNYTTNYLLEKGITPEADTEQQIRHMHIEEVTEYLNRRYRIYGTPRELLDDIIARIKRKYSDGYERGDIRVKPFVGANLELLKSLKAAGIPMAVATATHRPITEMILSKTGLSPYFDAVLTTPEVGVGKEKPDVYFCACEALHGNPNTCVVFEDAYVCASTAKNAGFYLVAVEDFSAREKAGKLRELADLYVADGQTVKFESGVFTVE